MNNFLIEDKYKGQNLSKTSQSVLIQGKSPRSPSGKLLFRQNNLRFSIEKSTYSLLYVTKVGGKPTTSSVVYDTTSAIFVTYNGTMSPDTAWQNLSLYSDLQRDSMAKCLNKAGSFRANLLDMYRTRQETVNMVNSAAKRLLHAYRCLKRRNFRGFCGALGITHRIPRNHMQKNAPELWLEYIYGWKPLIQDVFTLIDHPFPEPYLICRARSKFDNFDITQTSVSNTKHHRQRKLSVTNHTRLRMRTNGNALAAASQLGVTNPAALAWEALPFSFVVDWFFSVGGYLEKLTSLAGLLLDNCSQTLTIETTVTRNVSFTKLNGYDYIGTGHSQSVYRMKDRAVVSPVFPFPQLESPVSLSHFATTMSLLSTAFQRNR